MNKKIQISYNAVENETINRRQVDVTLEDLVFFEKLSNISERRKERVMELVKPTAFGDNGIDEFGIDDDLGVGGDIDEFGGFYGYVHIDEILDSISISDLDTIYHFYGIYIHDYFSLLQSFGFAWFFGFQNSCCTS